MISKLSTFIGSILCTFLWMPLSLTLDVSSPDSNGSLLGGLTLALIVGTVFMFVDLLLGREPGKSFSGIVLDVFLVSSVGSFVVLFGLGLGLMVLSYIPFRNIYIEAFAALILAFFLFCSNFICVLILRVFAHSITPKWKRAFK